MRISYGISDVCSSDLVDRRRCRAGLGTLRHELARPAVARVVIVGAGVVEDVVGGLGQQRDRAVVAADEGAGAVGQGAELVRVDRDLVGTAERGERGVHLRQREAGETLADFLDRAQAAVLVAKQGGEVAAQAPSTCTLKPSPFAAQRSRASTTASTGSIVPYSVVPSTATAISTGWRSRSQRASTSSSAPASSRMPFSGSSSSWSRPRPSSFRPLLQRSEEHTSELQSLMR